MKDESLTEKDESLTERFARGHVVRMTPDAVVNYGPRYEGASFRVVSVSRAYMPAAEFYAEGKPAGFHPGFDESAGCALYDLHGLNMSLYDWELV